jgi:uncharacterized protein DUF4252
MKRIPLLTLLIAAAVPLAAQIQIPGWTSAGSLDNLAAKAKDFVNITLDSSMLQLATSFFSKNDQPDGPGLKKLISGLKNIAIRKYSYAEEGQYNPADLQPIRDQLRANGWGVLIGKHDEGGSTDIYSKSVDGHVAGLGVVKVEPKEVTVVYIEGAIDLASLVDLAGHFGVTNLGLPGQKSKTPQ